MAFGAASRRGASQPATDGSQTAGASRAPSGASLVDGHLTKHRAFESAVANKRSFAIIIIAIISNAASQTGSALAKGFYVRSDRSVLAQARRGGEVSIEATPQMVDPANGSRRCQLLTLSGMTAAALRGSSGASSGDRVQKKVEDRVGIEWRIEWRIERRIE